MQAGYSANPLTKKLGIKDGYHCLVVRQPDNYFDLLENLPPHASFYDTTEEGQSFDFIHAFVRTRIELENDWPVWKKSLKKTGMLWISWPKQTSGLATLLNGNEVREFGLAGGLVDTKVCAVDQDWSGLKFMFRKTDR